MKKLFCFALLTLFLSSCNGTSDKDSESLEADEIVFKKEGTLKIHKADSTSIDLEIEIAETSYETATGLMYRNAMDEDRGMLFIFGSSLMHSFYMKNTEFPLDIIYVKTDKTIATIVKNAQPFSEESLPSKVAVQYVLEVNGGMTEKWGVKEGDSISWKKD